MKAFFEELFEYNQHSNQKLFEIFRDYPEKTSEKSVVLYNHIINAHHIWNSRIVPAEHSVGVWELHPLSRLQELDSTNYQRTCEILGHTVPGLNIRYTNTKGQTFLNSVRDILFHVINHSNYHRAQIASEFKAQGIEPPVTDYIFYKRSEI